MSYSQSESDLIKENAGLRAKVAELEKLCDDCYDFLIEHSHITRPAVDLLDRLFKAKAALAAGGVKEGPETLSK